MPVIRYTNTIKSIWEKYLRVIFSSNTTPEEYRYNPNEKKSKIRIYKEFPRRAYNLPLITISAQSGDASLRYLGNEVVKDVNNMYNECVQKSTLRYKPIKNSVVGVYSLDKNFQKTVYIANKDFRVDWINKTFIWDLGVEEPELYYATYATFDSKNFDNTVYNEYKQKYKVISVRCFSDSTPQGSFNAGDKYFNEKNNKIYTYENGKWTDTGEYPELGILYLDQSRDFLFEFTTKYNEETHEAEYGMVRVYSYSGYPRLYLNYYEPTYEGFLIYDDSIVEGYVVGEAGFDYKSTTYLEYPSSSIIEVYTYDKDGNKLYYNRDEVYCINGNRDLIWNVPEPENYFVSYISSKGLLSNSGKFVQSPLNVTIKFDVYARSSQDRERITDLLVLYIRHLVKPYVAPYFVYSGEQVSGESQETLDNQQIYKNSVTVPCVSHYSNYIDNSTYALIKAIRVDVEAE